MRWLSHSLAPRTDSAAGGAAMSQESVLLPAMDSMGSEEPRFVLAPCDHCFDPAIPAGHPGAFEQRGAKPRRTISVGVEKNENASTGPNTLSGEADIAFQYPLFDHPGAMDANRFQDPRRIVRRNFLRYPPKQHRHRLHFAVAFDNRQNGRQAQSLRNRSTRCGAASRGSGWS